MKTIKANQTLTSSSICDSNCIFSLQVVDRKGKFATISRDGKVNRTKVYVSIITGDEFLMPDKYSMAPAFSAIN